MRLPYVEKRFVPLRKVVDYLLNPDHPSGGSKSRFFLAHGFRRDTPDVLVAALMRHPLDHDAVPSGVTPFGEKYKIEGLMLPPSGRSFMVRTIWMLDLTTGAPQFVSAYPR